jgi:CRP/FNR family cyclic AMP-dependent transcriptional regulator
MDEVPGFARALMREFARRYDGTLKLLEAARHRGAEERLCIALQHLRREGRATPAGRRPVDDGAHAGGAGHARERVAPDRQRVAGAVGRARLDACSATAALEIARWPTPTA